MGEAAKDDMDGMDQVHDILKDCVSNIAAALEAMGQWTKAKEACIDVLKFDPDHVKTLVRAGRICTHQDLFEEAHVALNKAAVLDPDNKSMLKAKKALRKKVMLAEKKAKQAYGGFLKPVSKEKSVELEQERKVKEEEKVKKEEEKEKDKKTTIDEKETKIETKEEGTTDKVVTQQEGEEPNKLLTLIVLLLPFEVASVILLFYLLWQLYLMLV